MQVKGRSGVSHEFYYYDGNNIIEVYNNRITEREIMGLVIRLHDIGIDWQRDNDGYKIRVIAPRIKPEAADYIREYGYVFIESNDPEKTAEEIKSLTG